MDTLKLTLYVALLFSATALGLHQKLINLDVLYARALAEGGHLIVYAGGDTADQQDYFKAQFLKRFPNMTMEVIVDYSKNHDVRTDHQLATGKFIPDVVQLQTVQDFPRWKSQGHLMAYKPLGWNFIDDRFKDPEGFFTGIYIISFSYVWNRQDPRCAKVARPRGIRELLSPALRDGKILSTYPHDDDAVLFWYKQMVDKYGLQFLQKFKDQRPRFVRGTQAEFDIVNAGDACLTPSTACSLEGSDKDAAVFVIPDSDPFVTWPQTAAIFKKAPRPNAAKLYLSWLLDYDTQKNIWIQWSVRKDVPPKRGVRDLASYSNQTDPSAFGKWMNNRAEVERMKTLMALYYGEVQGPASPGYPGLYPEKALNSKN